MSSGEEDKTSVYEETVTTSGFEEEPARVDVEKRVRASKPATVSTSSDAPVTASDTGVDILSDEPSTISSVETKSSTPTSVTYEVRSVEVPTDSEATEEESVSAKAKEAGRSLKDLVYSIGKKTKQVSEQKTAELKTKSVDIGASTDAKDIQNLGAYVDELVQVFEDTMTEIRKETYSEQERLLAGYRKLLEEQINVVNARLNLAKRLKPGA